MDPDRPPLARLAGLLAIVFTAAALTLVIAASLGGAASAAAPATPALLALALVVRHFSRPKSR